MVTTWVQIPASAFLPTPTDERRRDANDVSISGRRTAEPWASESRCEAKSSPRDLNPTGRAQRTEWASTSGFGSTSQPAHFSRTLRTRSEATS